MNRDLPESSQENDLAPFVPTRGLCHEAGSRSLKPILVNKAASEIFICSNPLPKEDFRLSRTKSMQLGSARKIFVKEQFSLRRMESSFRVAKFDQDLEKLSSDANEDPDRYIQQEKNSYEKDESIPCTPSESECISPFVTDENILGVKRVRFNEIEIREFPIIVGVSGITSSGPPLTISWKSLPGTFSVDVEKYEAARTSNRRKSLEMAMTAYHREQLLRDLGFSRGAISEATKESSKIRDNRHATNDRIGFDHGLELMESTRRKLENLLSLGSKKRKERRYLRESGIPLSPPSSPTLRFGRKKRFSAGGKLERGGSSTRSLNAQPTRDDKDARAAMMDLNRTISCRF